MFITSNCDLHSSVIEWSVEHCIGAIEVNQTGLNKITQLTPGSRKSRVWKRYALELKWTSAGSMAFGTSDNNSQKPEDKKEAEKKKSKLDNLID